MAMTADRMTNTHPFLDGRPKRMLIDGKWVDAASGKTVDSINPATGEVLAQVAEGDAEDIRRAVAAAKGADYDRGYFVPPTVFADVRDEMKIAQEEIFGLVISAIPSPTSTR